MSAIARQLFGLFVDKPWLAMAALGCVAACAASIRAGAPPRIAAGGLILGLGAALSASIRAALRLGAEKSATIVRHHQA